MKNKRKPRGYWQNWKNTRKELKRAIKENNGEFPTARVLNNIGMSSLVYVISCHGGFDEIRSRMGFEIRKISGNYQDWNKFENELKIAIKQNNGEFPSSEKLYRSGFLYLSRAIVNFHGGFSAVREKMGYDQIRKSKNFWKDWENFKNEIQVVIDGNNGKFPSTDYLRRNGFSMILSAGYQYHGGFEKIKDKMSYNKIKNPDGYYKKWDNFKRDMKLEIEENNGKFPTDKYLRKRKKCGLLHAIPFFGGTNAVREKMGFKQLRKQRGHYQKWDNFKEELERAIEENNGEFPNQEWLRKNDYVSVEDAICEYYGGYPAVRERIGYHEAKRQELARKLEKIIMEI